MFWSSFLFVCFYKKTPAIKICFECFMICMIENDNELVKTWRHGYRNALLELNLTHCVPAQPAFEKRDRTHGGGLTRLKSPFATRNPQKLCLFTLFCINI